MIKNRNNLCHSKYSIFDCQNNELLRIKMPTDGGEYSNKYQVNIKYYYLKNNYNKLFK